MYQRPPDSARNAAAKAVTSDHEVILGLIDVILHEGRAFVLAQEVDSNDRLAVARLLLLVRMLNHLEAISRLCELGFETEGLILYRSMMEALLRIAGICRSPESVNDYWAQYLLQRKGMYEDLLAFLDGGKERSPVSPEQVQGMLDGVLKTIGEIERESGRQIRAVSAFKWAQLGHIEDFFFLRYRLGSIPVHHAPQDLARHMQHGENGELQGLLLGPEASDLGGLLRDSADLASMALATVEDAIGASRSGALAEAAREVRAMYGPIST